MISPSWSIDELLNATRTWRLGSVGVLAAAALALGGCADDSTEPGKQIAGGDNNVDHDAGYQTGGGSGGGGGGDQDGGFADSDDEREGFYEISETRYNEEGCDVDAAEAEATDFSYVVIRYEMTEAGPAYSGYLCEGDGESCDLEVAPNPWVVLDVEAADAEELPAPEDRAEGALLSVYYDAEWTDGQCTAWRAHDEADFTGDGVSLTTTTWSALAQEIVSENTCTPEAARELSEDRFDCATIDVWYADKR
ncbi:MAG: hypothetical protein ACOC9W_06555 [Persicimonas sp.]